MAIVGRFHITGSFKLTGRGLVAMGQLTEGKVRDGDWLTLDTGFGMLTIQIRGVDMGGSVSIGSSFVGLTFVWQNEEQRKTFESVQLPNQFVAIEDGPSQIS
jgi:hypothetical protein